MAAQPRPNPAYVPDPPSRLRWVPPLGLGVALGGLIGCLATFVILELGKRSGPVELAAQQFNIATVLNNVDGTGGVTLTGDTTNELGNYYGGQPGNGSAVHRRIKLQGSLPKDAEPGAFARQIKTAIDAELGRLGAFPSGGGSNTSSGGSEARHTEDASYYTRDGCRGCLDLDLVVRDGRVEGLLILTEGK